MSKHKPDGDEKLGLTRRAVLVGGAAGASLAVLGACGDTGAGLDDESGEATSAEAGPETGAETGSATSAETGSETSGDGDGDGDGDGACEPTATDIEGPFYRPNIPIGGDLDVHSDSGDTLIFAGTVAGADCALIENAVVELWHSSPRAPGSEPGDLDATYDSTDAFRYYGQVATDAQGRFVFNTLRPGWYLNGAQYRPAHLHVKIWVEGAERLTTQVYFVDDPFNDVDPWFNPDLAIDPDAQGMAELEFFV